MTNQPQPQTERRIEAPAAASAPAFTTPAAESFAGLSDIRTRMAEFRSQHGQDRVKALTVPLDSEQVQVVVRAPSRLEYERHTETLMKLREGKTAQALSATRTLVMSCALAPAADVLSGKLELYPALVDKLGEKILDMAGADAEVREETF